MGISLKTRARAWAPGHECEGRPRPQGGAGRLSVTAGTRRVVSTGMGMHARPSEAPSVCSGVVGAERRQDPGASEYQNQNKYKVGVEPAAPWGMRRAGDTNPVSGKAATALPRGTAPGPASVEQVALLLGLRQAVLAMEMVDTHPLGAAVWPP